MNPSQITDWCHQIIRSVAKKDGLYIDATMGKGHDTKLFMRTCRRTRKCACI